MSRENRYRFFNRAIIVMGALVIGVYGTEAALAVARNQIIVGFNYWNAPLFSMMQLIVTAVAAPFLVRYALKHWNDTSPPPPKD